MSNTPLLQRVVKIVSDPSVSPDAFPISERLDRIWIQRETERGRKLSYERAVREIAEEQNNGVELMSSAYLNNLRLGKSRNPTTDVLRALSKYFRVDVNYFLTMSEEEANRLMMAHNIEHSESLAALVNQIATLSPAGQELIRSMVQFVLDHQAPLIPPEHV